MDHRHVGVPAALLVALRARLADIPGIRYAGAYGGRYGGWSEEAADVDLFIAWEPDVWREGRIVADVRADLVAIVESAGLAFDIAQGDGDALFPPDDAHPERRAHHLVGDALAGSRESVNSPAAVELAKSATTRAKRVALAAAARASYALDALDGGVGAADPPLIETLAAAFGYLAADGKDRRSLREQVIALARRCNQEAGALLVRAYDGEPLADDDPASLAEIVRTLAAELDAAVAGVLGRTARAAVSGPAGTRRRRSRGGGRVRGRAS